MEMVEVDNRKEEIKMNNNVNVGEKYLPIGTVVMLKGASKRLMITGFCSSAVEKENEMFDYSGCLYPEGIISSNQTALFNHDQIDKVFYKGLVDEEEVNFKTKLNEILNQDQQKTVVQTMQQNVGMASQPAVSQMSTSNQGVVVPGGQQVVPQPQNVVASQPQQVAQNNTVLTPNVDLLNL